MKPNKLKIEDFTLANNCPECYAQEAMVLTFYQEQIKNGFFEKLTKKINHSIFCQKCKQQIYPVKWTEDIERVYDFYYKTLSPKSAFKLTKLGIILIATLLLSVIAALLLWY
ncbi:hypothetical protein [Zhouia amylolytica]|uniref:Uncharacterized protein n=1 Tax=Zhouia amylolytica AD3 TaxID=1286632 RepID=W2UMA3_9FLAO|nr:hypothetical protein [Zhouia amylolytica]ETN94596.1 hypothetical protein P278_25390 [Zhouia amylolytica AD3]MCQ0111597.1 hypothetical protein [Zhouia amylolytica]